MSFHLPLSNAFYDLTFHIILISTELYSRVLIQPILFTSKPTHLLYDQYSLSFSRFDYESTSIIECLKGGLTTTMTPNPACPTTP